MNWSECIAKITSKASLVLSFLQQNSKCMFNKCKKFMLQVNDFTKSMDAPFGTHLQLDINSIEKIQRATRFITNDYSWNISVTQLLQNLNLSSFKNCRTTQKSIILYKIIVIL